MITYCKYFQNNINQSYILSAAQRSTSRCSFGGNLYTFQICNISLHLEELQCINNKNNCQFLVGNICAGKFIFIKIGVLKKSKCSQLLKVNLVHFFKRQQFFLRLAYNCSQVISLILFLVNILSPFFLIQQFNERFEIVQNTGCIKGFFCYVLGYHLFKNQSLVSLCQASTDQTCDKDSSLIFL